MAEKNFIVRNGLTVTGGVTIDSDISIGGSLTVGGAAVTPGLDSAEIKTLLSGGTGITYTEATGAIATNDSEIVHDNLSGFVADEHVAHSTVSITAGNGLTGGGDISASRTINVVGGTGITVSADAVEITASGVAAATYGDSSTIPVITVNDRGQVTAVVGASVNIPEGYTDANVDSHLSGGTGITYTSGVISTNDGQIVHDNLSGFVSNEHIDHTTVSITAGSGLTGGGDISTSRTLNIGEGTGITVSADAISTNDGEIVHDNLSGFVSNEHIDHSGVTITAGSGLTGGGDITASRTLNIGGGTGITVSADAISTNDGEIVHDNLSGYVANEHIDHSGVTLTAGTGLNGGGTIAASRTFAIDSAEFLAYFEGSINHDNLSGFVANEHINHSSVSITAGSGLTGGGDITTTRTLNIGEGTGITVSADAISTNDGEIVHDNLSGYVANEHIDHSGVSITAGSGLTGGGDITTSRTINVGAGTGVTVNADNIAIGQSVATTANVTFNSVTTTDGLIVGGNLQVNGTTTTVDTENLSVSDNMIYMNDGESAGSPTLSIDVGWAANVNDPGSYQHVGMFRDATDDTFKVFEGYTPEPDDALEINTGHASFSLAPFAARTLSGKYLGADSDIDAHLSGGTGITYSAGAISTNDGQIVHDNLSGFVANEHIDHTAVSVTAGAGLTGGGTIAATRTINIGEGTGITVSADAISTNDAEIVHDNLSGFVANEHIDHSTVSISAGTGLTGGGTIAATRTLSIANTGVQAGTYGSAALVPVFTVNAQGQIDSAGEVSVAGVSSFTFDSVGGNLTIGTADGGSYNVTLTLDPYTTDTLSEGATNLYHTTSRARAAISVTDAGGDGSLGYNSGTGVITYTGPSASEVRAHFSAGTGIGLASGVISNSGVLSVNGVTGAVSAANLLTAIKTVDGAGSGLDADLLDGQSGAYYRIDVYNSAGTLLN